jgi:hypothetical protein
VHGSGVVTHPQVRGQDTYSVGILGNRKISSFRNIVFSSLYNTGRWKRSKNPVIFNENSVAYYNIRLENV